MMSSPTLKLSAKETLGNSTWKTAGSATFLKPMQLSRSTSHCFKTAIPTVWLDPVPATDEEKTQKRLGKTVSRMQNVLEAVTQKKIDKRDLVDEMYRDCSQKVHATEKYMEAIQAALVEDVSNWEAACMKKQNETFDELDLDLKVRSAAITARYERLKERAGRLSVTIDEEVESRKVHIEKKLLPIRELLYETIVKLENEHGVRDNNTAEMKAHIDGCVERVDGALDKEKQNRQDRHMQAIIERIGLEDEDVESTLQLRPRAPKKCEHGRLVLRSEKLVTNDNKVRDKLSEDLIGSQHKPDLKGERQLRQDGQDKIVLQIVDFIQRFQAHCSEEGEAGD